MGLERAGWRTVSFSEIDPYASAVLAERWPGVPNLGDIQILRRLQSKLSGRQSNGHVGQNRQPPAADWQHAFLWTGGFPCQDLSVAGKRRGMGAGTRSGLAFAFLDLVERHRPPAILLENVPGLLSSHRGRDMAVLLGRMAELGYGVAFRVLDARHFGVPQRRRRVFILGLRSSADDPTGRVAAERAAAVLAVGTRCDRHPPAGVQAGPGAAAGTPLGSDEFVGPVDGALGHHGVAYPQQSVNMGHIRAFGPPSDPRGVRASDGLAGRPHDRDGVADTLNSGGNSGGFRTEPGAHLVAFVKAGRAQSADDGETWKDGDVMPTLNSFDVGDVRTTAAILGTDQAADPLLPAGLDSHRYRCCGNGVVADVAEWVGRRLANL